jgi:catechol 2,3-dioxygenase-like lactoylglutathione lyase family enzyme
MFDHIGLRVGDLAKSVAFYQQALGPLGFELASQGAGYAGFGPAGQAQLWLYAHEVGSAGRTGPGTHVALKAPDAGAVERFHAQALTAGAKDNGAPGLRADYSPTYYAAFVIDPDGNNVEAVCYV